MKPVITLVIWLMAVLVVEVYAQQKPVDIIYLKNGSQHTGEIISYEQGKKLILRESGGTEIELDDADIAKIYQGAVLDEKEGKMGVEKKPAKALKARTKGVYNTVNVVFGLGGGNTNGLAIAAGLHNVIGYQWNPWLGTGIGIGVDSYSRRGETVFPLYGELRSFLPVGKNKHSYYLALLGGYGMAFKREKLDIFEAEGGWMAHPAIGYRTVTKEGTDVNLDFGIKFQKALFSQVLSNGDIERRDLLFRRLTIRIGLTLWK